MPKRRCCCERQCLCTLTVHVREPRVSPRPLVIGALAARSQSCLPRKRYPVGLTTVVPQSTPPGGRYPRGLPPPAEPPKVQLSLYRLPVPLWPEGCSLRGRFPSISARFNSFLRKIQLSGLSLPCWSLVATVALRWHYGSARVVMAPAHPTTCRQGPRRGFAICFT